MPWESIAAAKKAGAPVEIDNVPLSLTQINALASQADAISAAGGAKEPWAVAIAGFKKRYKKVGHKWVEKKSKEAKMADEHALETEWIEVFRSGEYPQGDFTPEHLKTIADSYDPKVHEAPATLDHMQSGPAYGWVKAVKAAGNILLAKFSKISTQLKDLVQSGAYKKRSVEIYSDFNGSGKPYLKAVSWLGAKIPQVKGQPDAMLSEDAHGPVAFVLFEEHSEEEVHEPDLQGEMDMVKLRTNWNQALSSLENEAWHILGSGGDSSDKKKALIDLVAQLRSVVEQKEFKEMPKDEKVLFPPAAAEAPKAESPRASEPATVKPSEPASTSLGAPAVQVFTEAQVRDLMTDMQVKFEDRLKERDSKIAALETHNQDIRSRARAQEIHAFCEDQKREGRLLPAWQKNGLEAFMEHLENPQAGVVLSFGEEKLDPGKWFRAFLKGLPKIIEFGEHRINGKSESWERDDKPVVLSLHEKAVAYAEKEKCNYGEALAAVSRDNPEESYQLMAEHGYHIPG